MKLLAAYVLLLIGGNEAPTAENVSALITSVGGEVDEEKLALLLTDLEGKDIHELLAKGDNDLKSVVGVGASSGGIDWLYLILCGYIVRRLRMPCVDNY